MYICIFTYIYIYIHTCIHIYIYICMCICTYTYTYNIHIYRGLAHLPGQLAGEVLERVRRQPPHRLHTWRKHIS